MVLVLNRLDLPQGLHAPFVATGALVIFGARRGRARLGLPRRLYRRPGGRQPARRAPTTPSSPSSTPRPGSRRSPCSCCSACWPGRAVCRATLLPALGDRCHADVHRAPGGGVSLPGAVPLLAARKAVHLLGRPARRGRHLHRLDPAAGRLAEGATSISTSASWSCWCRSWCRAGPLRRRRGAARRAAARRATRRAAIELDLPGQLEQELVGYPRRRRTARICAAACMPSWAKPTLVVRDERVLIAGGGAAVARGRLRLSPGAAREGAGARPLLRRHAARRHGRTRGCWATSSCRATPRSARWRKSTACRSRRRMQPMTLAEQFIAQLCRCAEGRRPRAARRDRAGRAAGGRWPGHDRRPAISRSRSKEETHAGRRFKARLSVAKRKAFARLQAVLNVTSGRSAIGSGSAHRSRSAPPRRRIRPRCAPSTSASRGRPSATSRPRSITSTRSAKRAASARSCTIASTAPPACAASRSSSITMS